MAVLPPEGRASVRLEDNAVQVFKMANARPSIDKVEKLRRSSCLMPMAASWPSSAMLLWRRPWPLAMEVFRKGIVG